MQADKISRRDFFRKFVGVSVVAGGAMMLGSCSVFGRGVYKVNASACTGCRKCLSACSAGALSMSGGKAVISSTDCVGCGHCVGRCPEGAISEA